MEMMCERLIEHGDLEVVAQLVRLVTRLEGQSVKYKVLNALPEGERKLSR